MKSFKEFVNRRDPELINELGFVGNWLKNAWDFGAKEVKLGLTSDKLKALNEKSARLLDNAYKPLLEKMTEFNTTLEKTSQAIQNVQTTIMKEIQDVTVSFSKGGQKVMNPADLQEIQKVQDHINQKTQKSLTDFGKIKTNLANVWNIAQANQAELSELINAAQRGVQSQSVLGKGKLAYTGTGGANPDIISGQMPGYNRRKASKIIKQGRDVMNTGPQPENPNPTPVPTP
jgi:hypothetical protein